jgi:hypothetical protein
MKLLALYEDFRKEMLRSHGLLNFISARGVHNYVSNRKKSKFFKRKLLENELGHIQSKMAQGLLIELDYAVAPRVRDWRKQPRRDFFGELLSRRSKEYIDELRCALDLKKYFLSIPIYEPADEGLPWWGNPWFPVLDAIYLTSLLVRVNPRIYMEIGSGSSTKFARNAIAEHRLRTKIVSIDPYPRECIDSLCDRIIRSRIEDCDPDLFDCLSSNDVMFIDNSHRSFQNTDVTVFFTELLPYLPSGCHYGLHDIFLPNDYPAEWSGRYYNEQYLLMAYLLGGAAGDKIVMPMHFVQNSQVHSKVLDPVVRHISAADACIGGGAFWMKKN